MPLTPDPASAAQAAARKRELSNLNPDDIDSEKVDQMVRRLFNELDRQLKQAEQSRNQSNDATARAADARTLASLERTMEHLSRIERDRAAMRNSRASKKNEAVRKEIERKWTRILEIAVAEEILGQPDGSGAPPTLH
jgi:erythromycin esterase-like protein